MSISDKPLQRAIGARIAAEVAYRGIANVADADGVELMQRTEVAVGIPPGVGDAR